MPEEIKQTSQTSPAPTSAVIPPIAANADVLPSAPATPNDNRLQEILLILSEKLGRFGIKGFYWLLGTVVFLVVLYYGLMFGVYSLIMSRYHPPEITYQPVVKEPLKVVETKIFDLGGGSYSGYARVRNINLESGVRSQPYSAEFRTYGGTSLNKIQSQTFILPSTDKILVFPRFTADRKPDELTVTLGETRFVSKPSLPLIDFGVQRVSTTVESGELRIKAGIINNSPVGLSRVGLPVVLYNNSNEVVGVSYTFVNDLQSRETRTFEYFWPINFVPARVEILPEINVFDEKLLILEEERPIFDDVRTRQP